MLLLKMITLNQQLANFFPLPLGVYQIEYPFDISDIMSRNAREKFTNVSEKKLAFLQSLEERHPLYMQKIFDEVVILFVHK